MIRRLIGYVSGIDAMAGVLAVFAMAGLAGCAKPLTGSQSVYAAYAGYTIAVEASADYAESPVASPAIVARLNGLNQSPATRKAVAYGRAYATCLGSNATQVAGFDCRGWDFSAPISAGYAVQLRNIRTALLER